MVPGAKLTNRNSLFALTAIFAALGCGQRIPPPPGDVNNNLQTDVIARGAGCESCTLVLTKLGSIGSEGDLFSLTRGSLLALRGDGRYIAVPTTKIGEAAIYDSLDAVGRVYGRAGEGPGEMGSIQNVFPWPGDSVILIEGNRFNILGGELGRGRSIRLETNTGNWRSLVLFDDSLVVMNYSRTPQREYIARRFDGSIHAQMGHRRPDDPMGDVYQFLGMIGPSQTRHAFWEGKERYRMQLTLFDAREGRIVQQIPYSAPWYTPYDSTALYNFVMNGGDEMQPPPPFLRGIRERVDSVVWTLYSVPALDWAPSGKGPVPKGQVLYRRDAYDGILDLRNPTTGESLLTVRMNLPLIGFINDTLLLDRRETADGVWTLDVYKAEFSKGGRAVKP